MGRCAGAQLRNAAGCTAHDCCPTRMIGAEVCYFKRCSLRAAAGAVAAITPAEYAIPRAKALSGGKVAVQRLTAP
jgi:hypothetical protein